MEMEQSVERTGGFLKAARWFLIILAASIGAANIGWNIYLLDTRPTVSLTVPDHVPDRWLCGRVVEPPHCVVLSEQDRATNTIMQASFLVVLPFFLALAFWEQARRPSE
jgi:hypothetical protein